MNVFIWWLGESTKATDPVFFQIFFITKEDDLRDGILSIAKRKLTCVYLELSKLASRLVERKVGNMELATQGEWEHEQEGAD